MLAPTPGQLGSRDPCSGKRISPELEGPTHHGDVWAPLAHSAMGCEPLTRLASYI